MDQAKRFVEFYVTTFFLMHFSRRFSTFTLWFECIEWFYEFVLIAWYFEGKKTWNKYEKRLKEKPKRIVWVRDWTKRKKGNTKVNFKRRRWKLWGPISLTTENIMRSEIVIFQRGMQPFGKRKDETRKLKNWKDGIPSASHFDFRTFCTHGCVTNFNIPSRYRITANKSFKQIIKVNKYEKWMSK